MSGQSHPPIPAGGFAGDFFDNLPCGYFRRDADSWEFEFLSPRFLKITGYTEAEFRQVFHNCYAEMIYEEDRARVLREVEEQIAAGVNVHCEYRVHTRGGGLKQVDEICALGYDGQGRQWLYSSIAETNVGLTLLRSLLTYLPAGMVIFDFAKPGLPLFVSEQALRIFGLSAAEFEDISAGKTTFNFFPDNDFQLLRKKIADNPGQTGEIVYRAVGRQGQTMHLRATCSLRTLDDGRSIGYTVLTDVSEQIAVTRKQQQQEEIFKMLMDDTGNIVFDYDVDEDVMDISLLRDGNRTIKTIKRYLAEFATVSLIHHDHIDMLLGRFREAKMRPISDHCSFQANIDGQGYRWFRSYYKSVVDENGRVCRIIGRFRDSSAEVEAAQKLQRRADIDGLSGIYNRAKTVEMINERLRTDVPGCKHTLMVFDIDRFKQINDTCGHPMGDKVIGMVAAVLRSLFRSDDVLGRIGGDEFAVLTTTPETFRMTVRAERLQALAREIADKLRLGVKVSLSIGMAEAPRYGRDFDTLFLKADKALYAAKRGGRDRWVVYHESGELED